MSEIRNTKRIARNTMMMYVRMLFIMVISIYISRVLLNVLGVEDYGVYNVVGGFVSIFGVLQNSMLTSTQRFLNYQKGKDAARSLFVFSNAVNVHVIIGLCTLLLLESVGLWFLYNYLTIPKESFNAAVWVFHCSVISFFITIINSPYRASIIANERMDAYAILSIIDIVLKLSIALVLRGISYNKLQVYGILVLVVSIFMQILYSGYCRYRFNECRYKWCPDLKLIKEMVSFSWWMLFGCTASMLSKQGVNVLINIFFGPVLNASRAVAFQLSSALNTFVQNFMIAVKPQITKSYASGDFDYMNKLVYASTKVSIFLLMMIAIPFFVNTEYILNLWLGNVPESSVIFTKLVIIETVILNTYTAIAQVNQASGIIRRYQLWISILYASEFVFTYIAFKLGAPVYGTFIISIIIVTIGLLVRCWILKIDNAFPSKDFLIKTVMPFIPVLLISVIPCLFIEHAMEDGFIKFVVVCITTFAFSSFAAWFIGLNSFEKSFIRNNIGIIINRLRHDKNRQTTY